MRIVADYAPEDLARQYMIDRALLTAWSGIFRSRWNGVPADMIKTWFIYENSTDLASSILATEHEPKAEISSRLSSRTSAVLDAMDMNRVKTDIDSAASDVLRDTVLACRMVSFGAERVLSYLVAIEVELVNLELCLSAIANGIDRDVTLSRLRREYA
jgi:vacuolar-type H+-ATPase subunit C/Vma6